MNATGGERVIAPSPRSSGLTTAGSLLAGQKPQIDHRIRRKDYGPSLFESCLKHSPTPLPPGGFRAGDEESSIKGLYAVQESLLSDEARQRAKYHNKEPSSSWARFNVELPHGRQHTKFSAERGILGQTPRDYSLTQPQKQAQNLPKFSMRTLRKWFKEIDSKGEGRISERDLLCSLRKHEDIQTMLLMAREVLQQDGSSDGGSTLSSPVASCSLSSLGDGPPPGSPHRNVSLNVGVHAMTTEDKQKARNKEIKRIKDTLKEFDTDRSGTLEWAEFAEFFKSAGLIAEYQTLAGLTENRVSVPKGVDDKPAAFSF